MWPSGLLGACNLTKHKKMQYVIHRLSTAVSWRVKVNIYGAKTVKTLWLDKCIMVNFEVCLGKFNKDIGWFVG